MTKNGLYYFLGSFTSKVGRSWHGEENILLLCFKFEMGFMFNEFLIQLNECKWHFMDANGITDVFVIIIKASEDLED